MNLPLLLEVLKDPARAAGCSLSEWDILVRQARAAALLPRLEWRLRESGVPVPPAPARHLDAARAVAQRQHVAVRWEVSQIRQALAVDDVSCVLLKGAAYVLAGLPAASGRTFTDVDILVPHERLRDAEMALMMAGWAPSHQNAYDQRYYREWMHEIPPMTHLARRSTLDLHHAILPLTSRIRSPAQPLLESARSVDGLPGIFVLCPEDLVLHSATHLFCGEFDHGLRDLTDLDLLIRDFGRDAGFLPRLLLRAQLLGLGRPLHYALRFCAGMLGTPIAREAIAQSAPGPLASGLMNAAAGRALLPDHETVNDFLSRPAWLGLYFRAHWLRMPLRLLLPHLAHKAFAKHEQT